MTTKKMNPDEEYEFYASPGSQAAQGPSHGAMNTAETAAPTRTTQTTILKLAKLKPQPVKQCPKAAKA